MNLVKYQEKTFELRGFKVMLDRDVAEALGVETRELNQNAGRSPKWEKVRERGEEFLYRFQVTAEEVENLRSQFVIFNEIKYLPWVYTQRGCSHFGTSLNSDEA